MRLIPFKRRRPRYARSLSPHNIGTAVAVVGVTVGLTAFVATKARVVGVGGVGGVGGRSGGGDDDVVANALRGVWVGQVAMVVLGALAATSEFATRTIRATLAAIPRRGVAFGAKATVVAATALALGSVTSVLSFQIAQPLIVSVWTSISSSAQTRSLSAIGSSMRPIADCWLQARAIQPSR